MEGQEPCIFFAMLGACATIP